MVVPRPGNRLGASERAGRAELSRDGREPRSWTKRDSANPSTPSRFPLARVEIDEEPPLSLETREVIESDLTPLKVVESHLGHLLP